MRLKLAQKLYVGFGMIFVVMIILAFVSYNSMIDMEHGSEEISYSADYDEAVMSNIIAASRILGDVGLYALSGDEQFRENIVKHSKEFNVLIGEMRALARTDRERSVINELVDSESEFTELGLEMADAFLAGDSDEALELLNKYEKMSGDIDEIMEDYEVIVMAIGDHAIAAAAGIRQKAVMMLILLTSIAVVAGGVFAYLFSKSMSDPTIRLAQAMNKMADGDLTLHVEVTTTDEIGEMTATFNSMTAKIKDMMQHINDSSVNVASASEQISSASEELAAGADAQHKQTVETASSMEEMASSVQLVFENSKKSLEAVEGATGAAEEGGAVVKLTLEGMGKIETVVQESVARVKNLGMRSKEIGKIVGVINEIAAQTNLLALNAAIEAARAGEHGRGFEVVAEEIRKLAEQSAKSTVQITSIVEEIQDETRFASDSMIAVTKEVEEGTKLSGQIDDTFTKIIGGVKTTNEMIRGMSEASRQQASVSDQVAKAVENISTITKESAASAEEIAGGTQELARHADNMKQLVSQFKLG